VGEIVCATGGTACLSLSAHTTDATHAIRFTASSGQSFIDNASVRTNELTYNASNGAGIRKTDAFGGIILFAGRIDYLTIDRLQLQIANATSSGGYLVFDGGQGGTHVVFQDLLLSTLSTSGSTSVNWAPLLARNVLLVNRTSAAANGFNHSAAINGTYIGVGAVRISGATVGGTAFARAAGVPILQSSYSFGYSTASATGWDGTNSKNNATDQSSIAGSSNQTSVTYTSSSPFTSAASAFDFRPVTAAPGLAANGYLDATNAPNDITGSLRPSTPTIGPWELLPATPSTAPTVRRRVIR
jgi:hypothetical protein